MTLNELSLHIVTYTYPAIAGFQLLNAYVRLCRYWQIQRDPWLLWKIATSLGQVVFFSLASTFISKAPLLPRDTIVPYNRIASMLILLPLSIAVIGQLHDIFTITRRREQSLRELIKSEVKG